MNFLFSMPNLYKILIFKIYGFTPDCFPVDKYFPVSMY